MMTRKLPCALTVEEWNAAASQLAQTQLECVTVEARKKAAMADFKIEGEKLEATAAELGEKVRTRKETRDVEVFERKVGERLVVEIYRSDLGELVETRPMTAEERNEVVNPRLPLGPGSFAMGHGKDSDDENTVHVSLDAPGGTIKLDKAARKRVEKALADDDR
jgi:hypothetical protein